jgi:hypothetical protein
MANKPRHPIEAILEHFLTVSPGQAEHDLAIVQAAMRARNKLIAPRHAVDDTAKQAAASPATDTQPPAGTAMQLADDPATRGRGRPAGSRNKRVRDRKAEQARAAAKRTGNGNGAATVAGTTSAPEPAATAATTTTPATGLLPLRSAADQATDEPDPAAE